MCWGARPFDAGRRLGARRRREGDHRRRALLTAAGAVKCWGDDLAAVDVPGLDQGVAAIASSGNHNCALTSVGGVKCWGLNDHGQLGDGTKTTSATPVDVVGLHGPAAAIATGPFHTCAVLRSGGIDCWGSNGAGQLGDGTTIDRSATGRRRRLRNREGDAVDRLAFGGRDADALRAGRRALRRSGALSREGHAQRPGDEAGNVAPSRSRRTPWR